MKKKKDFLWQKKIVYLLLINERHLNSENYENFYFVQQEILWKIARTLHTIFYHY